VLILCACNYIGNACRFLFRCNSTIQLNYQQKFNFWAAGRRKFPSSSTLLNVRYVQSPYRATSYCNSTLGYGRQVLLPTKKKNSPSADRRQLPTMAFGRWISTTKIDLKKIVTSLFSLCSNRFIRAVLVGFLLGLPSRNRDCHGQHGHGGAIAR
jgi:hypothetical protein